MFCCTRVAAWLAAARIAMEANANNRRRKRWAGEWLPKAICTECTEAISRPLSDLMMFGHLL